MKFLYILLIAITVVAYVIYVKYFSNEKAASSVSVRPNAYQLGQHAECNYLPYLEAIWECVKNNYKTCGLSCPATAIPPYPYMASAQHRAPSGQWVTYDEKYGIVYLYYFDREPIMTGNIHQGLKTRYTTIRVDDMVQVLNQTFGSNYCTNLGLSPKSILYGKDASCGRVYFAVGPFGTYELLKTMP